jgi:1,4-dihydroxy-2-naphthoate octaprenyltransferase
MGQRKMSLSFEVNAVPLISALLLSVLPACLTANIMLANNICDLEKDILVKRYTLPYYLGRKALWLFAAIYCAAYVSVLVMVIFRMISPLCLVIFLTIIPVQKNIKRFFKKQVKSETFIVSVQNFVIIIFAQIILVFASSLSENCAEIQKVQVRI